jgi:three-Cys-motif partner protein
MAKRHYDWSDGPAEIDAHSQTKHEILVEYLIRYFEQRTLNARGRDLFRITLIDGFCGGGLYKLRGTQQIIHGSPLRILKAVEAAQKRVNIGRTKPLHLDVQYVFIDKNKPAVEHLRQLLKEEGYEPMLDKSIHLICDTFHSSSERVLKMIGSHTPRSSKALFFLDQYGYTEVPAPLIQRIFSMLPSAEILLTFHVSAFATYSNDELALKVSETLKVDIQKILGGRTIDDLKSNDADWRRFIQGALYEALVVDCGAKFFTPFFIRGSGSGHGEYWLVHLSQHHRAQDVMKQVHWLHSNHSVHYGGPGLNMLAPHTMGFMQDFDGGFSFDDVARDMSDKALHTELGQRIFAEAKPTTFAQLFADTCNGSPATSSMYKTALEKLTYEGNVAIYSSDGQSRRRQAKYIVDTDWIEPNPQTRLL